MLTYVSAALNLPHLQMPRRQRGLTMVEYALGGALIVAIIIIAVTAVGTKANTAIDKIQSGLTP
jgi:Flp pilus assembly pilin Flp